MKKVLLIGAAPVSDSPYYSSYIEFMEQNNIPYDLLFWNRHLDKTEKLPTNFISYNHYTDNKFPFWKRLLNNWRFAQFASEWMCNHDYTYVVVFTIANTIFMYRVLKKYYPKRYIFDIRDFSPLLKYNFFRRRIYKLIKNAAFTTVSSAGFMNWLPKGKDTRYIVSHNTTRSMVEKYLGYQHVINPNASAGVITILTIGQLRDFITNANMMQSLNGNSFFRMVFAGYGPASNLLINYAIKNKISNVVFTGRYDKSEEESIVLNSQMMNLCLGQDINSNTLVTNRFYLSVQMRKPMIATKGSYQGYLCEKYGLGVLLDENDEMAADKIINWWQYFDTYKYNEGCRNFLESVLIDIQQFEKELVRLFQE